jgi:hypothetical protein
MRSLAFLCFSVMGLMAFGQPTNPSYTLSTNTFFELDMRPIALIDLESGGANANFTFNVTPPAEAGEGFGSNPLATNNNTWLNYSCAVRNVVSRKVQVRISSGSIPNGFELTLQVSGASGAGGGTLGTATGSTIVLSNSEQDIITGIQGAYTGNGANNGHQLTYSLNYTGIGGFGVVFQSTSVINISYTILDD